MLMVVNFPQIHVDGSLIFNFPQIHLERNWNNLTSYMYFVSWLLIDKNKIVEVEVEGKITKYGAMNEQDIFLKVFF